MEFDTGKAGYPDSWSQLKTDGMELLEDILEGGVFGDSSMSRKHSSNITLQAVSERQKRKEGQSVCPAVSFPGPEIYGKKLQLSEKAQVSSAGGLSVKDWEIPEGNEAEQRELRKSKH